VTALLKMLLPTMLIAAAAAAAEAPPKDAAAARPTDEENSCLKCHGEKDLWEGERLRLFVTEQDLAADIHWQKGLRCQDCHGGNPATFDQPAAHAQEAGFKAAKSPADIPEFCGNCHADVEFMRRYRPSPRTDQLKEYWTSGHGQALKTKADTTVATCVSCHDKPHGSGQDQSKHAVRPVDDMDAPVYRTRLAKTCAKCHSDEKLMADRQYHDRPIGHDQYQRWGQSVHARALLEKGDLSAPSCNNCHGNHGAVPPQVDSVANACGTCHGKIAALFAQARMKHKFEEVGLPGCATCHGNHEILPPTDKMLGIGGGAVCTRCHEGGKFGAPLAGAEAARKLHAGLGELKGEINQAEAKLAAAERLGMEVSAPRFDLRKAFDALTNARSLVHTFQVKPVEVALAEGHQVTLEVAEKADRALAEYTTRRVWLAASLVPVLLVIVLLLRYIRTLPVPPTG
jgi:predicted CXXCH cytochrome family protein